MDKIQKFLEIVPPHFLLGIALAALTAMLLTPSRLRIPLSLILMVVWLTVGRLPNSPWYYYAKPTCGMSFALVVWAAITTPGPRRKLPALLVYLHIGTALLGFIYVTQASDIGFALVIRLQWLMLTIAAILMVRYIVDYPTLMVVLKSLGIGAALSVAICASSFVLDSRGTFFTGVGRFTPYRANPNQIGPIFTIGVFLSFYLASVSQSKFLRIFFLGAGSLALGLGLLTASRSVAAAVLISCFPLMWALMRRPVALIVGVAIVAAALFVAITRSPQASFAHLQTLESSRGEILKTATQELLERPYLGILHRPGLPSEPKLKEGVHVHNAYLYVMYLGGFSFLLPTLMIVAITVRAAWVVWKNRRVLPLPPVLAGGLALLSVTFYAHGFTNHAIYYPTYTWAFLQVFCSCLVTSWAREIAQIKHSSLYGGGAVWATQSHPARALAT